MGPHGESAGERSEARTRATQISDFEYHWDGAFTGTVYEDGKFRTTYTGDGTPFLGGETVTGETITNLQDEARNYYARMHAHSSST
jgi:hypothetical protein